MPLLALEGGTGAGLVQLTMPEPLQRKQFDMPCPLHIQQFLEAVP